MVERGPEKAGVGGSIPSLATITKLLKPLELDGFYKYVYTYYVLLGGLSVQS